MATLPGHWVGRGASFSATSASGVGSAGDDAGRIIPLWSGAARAELLRQAALILTGGRSKERTPVMMRTASFRWGRPSTSQRCPSKSTGIFDLGGHLRQAPAAFESGAGR